MKEKIPNGEIAKIKYFERFNSYLIKASNRSEQNIIKLAKTNNWTELKLDSPCENSSITSPIKPLLTNCPG
jgi:hypothetical protein